MAAKWPDKDPDDELDYSLTWAEQMDIDTDTIARYAPFVVDDEDESDTTPVEIVQSLGKTPSFDDTNTLVWLSGGTAGKTYQIVNRIVTAEGRQYDHTRALKIKEH